MTLDKKGDDDVKAFRKIKRFQKKKKEKFEKDRIDLLMKRQQHPKFQNENGTVCNNPHLEKELIDQNKSHIWHYHNSL